MLARSRAWLAQTPDALAALAAIDPDPLAAAVSLRWLAALHHLALKDLKPWAGLWPPAEEPVSDEALDNAIAQAWAAQRPHLQAALALPPQTNEVQRSAGLLPGLLHIAAQTGLPMALVEVGASAGLNLWCDHYRHEHAAWSWGDPKSALTLRSEWLGPRPRQAPLRVDRRAACDAQPVDLARPGEALRLASFIWADQRERLARLQSACGVATARMAAAGLAVQTARAADFVRQQLKQRVNGQTLVLMHSVVWQYIAASEQADISAQMSAAGVAATAQSPLAWLRFEPPAPDKAVEVRCRIWPGGEDHLLARCHPHAARIEWLGPT